MRRKRYSSDPEASARQIIPDRSRGTSVHPRAYLLVRGSVAKTPLLGPFARVTPKPSASLCTSVWDLTSKSIAYSSQAMRRYTDLSDGVVVDVV